MGTTADKLQHLADTKELIKTAIQVKGQSFSGTETFRDYATKINNISNECTAVASNILSGKTAYSGGSKITGTIASKGAQTYSPSTSAQTIASGQYLSGTQTINPVTGTAVGSAVLSGYTYNSSSGIGLTGTMVNNGGVTSTITTQGGQYSIPGGFHNGMGKITASFANLSAGNIKSGVNVGGVVGTLEGVQPRTININNTRGSEPIGTFSICVGNSELVNITGNTSTIPTTISSYGDLLVFYCSPYFDQRTYYLSPTSGGSIIYIKDFMPGMYATSIRVIKLTSNTVNLTFGCSFWG